MICCRSSAIPASSWAPATIFSHVATISPDSAGSRAGRNVLACSIVLNKMLTTRAPCLSSLP